MISVNDLERGMKVEIDGEVFEVLQAIHTKIAQRQAHVRIKVRNIVTGQVFEKTFPSSEYLKVPNIEIKKVQFTYRDKDEYAFMDTETWEEMRLKEDFLKIVKKWLKEGLEVTIILKDDSPLAVEVPRVVELEVVETDPGVRGDTESGGSKPARLETGAFISVPLHIKIGDKVKVDTEREEYIGRA